MRIVSPISSGIRVYEMNDGDIAEIISWPSGLEKHVGNIVQRSGNDLVRLGETKANSWLNFFANEDYSVCQVRILPPGTRIEI